MRVLIFSQYYFPEGVPKPHDLAEDLLAKGHEVFVLTGFPHYPGGKLKAGYSLAPWLRETIHGVPVLRMFEIPYHSRNRFLRIINYLSFLLSAPIGALFVPKIDVIYVWHPPLTVGIAAWIISKIKRVPFVYDVQDIWGGFVVLSGMIREGTFSVKLIRGIEKFVAKRAAKLIVQTEAGRDYFLERGIADNKIAILPNWIDEKEFGSGSKTPEENIRREFGWADDFIVLFAGNLGIVQGLETVLNAAKEIRNSNTRIVLMGDGTDKSRLMSLAKELDIERRLHFVERQPVERMPALMAAADVLLVHLKKSGWSRFVVPSKTMSYLASGKPIIMAMNGAAAELIEQSRSGIVVEPENIRALADAIDAMSEAPSETLIEMGANGRRFLIDNLSKEKVVARYENLLRQAAEECHTTKN